MKHRSALLCACALLTALFGGCSNETAEPAASSGTETQAATEAAPVSRNLYYITSHGTTDLTELSSFCTQLETDGYSITETALSDIPASAETADALIFNSPTEDMTREEMDTLNAYMETGGHLLLLLPANETETEYKYLSQFLEYYCLSFDYDRIEETDASRMVNADPYYLQADYISHPDNMPLYSAAQDSGIVYLKDARSFRFLYQDHFSRVKQDVILKTAASVIGAPFGGVEDDPLTYEETALDVMGYARNEELLNASIVYVGASEFLTDAAYDTESAEAMTAWVHSALAWFMLY